MTAVALDPDFGVRRAPDRLRNVIRLPRLAGRREVLHAVLAEQGLAESLEGEDVAVLAGQNLAAFGQFIDELIREVLYERKARYVFLVGSCPDFEALVREAAERHGFADRIHLGSAAALGI